LNKKIMLAISLLLLLFVGIIALTQELDLFFPDVENEQSDEEEYEESIIYNFKEPARWFRSNAGGMPLQEVQSRLVALRSEYALAIESAFHDELPDFLLPFYDEEYIIEVRMLYKKGGQIRTQWLFRDDKNITRMNAVLLEPDRIETEEEGEKKERHLSGFIEIYDENMNFVSEYRYLEDGKINRVDFEYNNNLLVSSTFYLQEENEEYKKTYADFYRYNRSLSLRIIERIFYADTYASPNDFLRISFPRHAMNAVNETLFISERLNLYPDFFGDVFIKSNSKMIFEADDRGRIMKQTLYDEEDEEIWVILNTWVNNRIVSTTKTEGDTVFLAEFQYNSSGDRVSERNLKNGVLERVVRTEGINEIEELYMNNILVMRAVWEEGRKVSETRVR